MNKIGTGLIETTLKSVVFLFMLSMIIQTLSTINKEFIPIGTTIMGATVLAVVVIIRKQKRLGKLKF